MSQFPTDLRYTNDHEWVRTSAATVAVGITQFAVDQLGDITLVELPKVGDMVTKGQRFGTVESVKSVSDLYAPVSGTVAKVNDALKDAPELVNQEPYAGGWMIEITPAEATESDDLMDADAYAKHVESQ